MSWNYRIVYRKEKHPLYDPTKNNSIPEYEEYYFIGEVYYDKEGRPNGLSAREDTPISESPEGIKAILEMMEEALEKPVIEYNEIVKENDGEDKKINEI